jgi:outer membrane protein assembly factor BamD (BamD/ComL family)
MLCLSSAKLVSAANATSQEAEQMLAKAVTHIQAQQLTQALTTLDQLIQRYPHFQLAQMMRADLLLAQTHTLPNIGGQLDVQKTQALQAEARARLNADRKSVV